MAEFVKRATVVDWWCRKGDDVVVKFAGSKSVRENYA